jgi:hypothetical protein
MRHRLLIPLAALTFALAACGGGGSPTQGPGAITSNPGAATDGGGGGEATPGAQPTDAGPGGGGGTGGGTGRIQMEIGGPVHITVDEPFFAIGSRFGGEAGTSLNFTDEGAEGIASIGVINDLVVISWADETLVANSQECKLSNWNIGTASGSGSFDCTGGVGTNASGTYLQGITMKGSFEAGL